MHISDNGLDLIKQFEGFRSAPYLDPVGIRIARQQWRARIETSFDAMAVAMEAASPASNGGRGLKLERLHARSRRHRASPASNGGRGLKRRSARPQPDRLRHRPPAMAGAD